MLSSNKERYKDNYVLNWDKWEMASFKPILETFNL